MKVLRLINLKDPYALIPEGKFCSSFRAAGIDIDEEALLNKTRERFKNFEIPFDFDHWESLSIIPYMQGKEIAYLNISGQTIVTEGRYYINDIIDGEDASFSPHDEPFFCIIKNLFFTNDSALCHRGLTDPQIMAPPAFNPPDGFESINDLLITAGLYLARCAAGGEVTLEANREYGQRFIYNSAEGGWIYEYWLVGNNNPYSVSVFKTPIELAVFISSSFMLNFSEKGFFGTASYALLERLSNRKNIDPCLILAKERSKLMKWAGMTV